MPQYHSISDRALGSWVEIPPVVAWWKTCAAALRRFLQQRRARRRLQVSDLGPDWIHAFTIESAKHRDDR